MMKHKKSSFTLKKTVVHVEKRQKPVFIWYNDRAHFSKNEFIL